jgi:uncharacterized protein involved in exopolysaccharide biosynthesis
VPRTYKSDTKILAQRNLVMATLGNPHRSVPHDADMPTRSAAEAVLKRDNLVSLIKQVNLMDEWKSTRAPILQVRDKLIELVSGEKSEEDRLEELVGLLSKRLVVTTEEGTVKIELEWPDATLAYRIVSAAQQNFLESRHAEEVSSIAETITILEGHAASIRENIENAITDFDRPAVTAPESPDPAAAAKAAARRAAIAQNSALDRERSQLRTMIFAKRKAITDLEEFRNRRLAELQATLAEQMSVYAEQHPAVVNTKQTISSLSMESPQIAALKKQEQELINEYKSKGGVPLPAGADDASVPQTPALPALSGGIEGARSSGAPRRSSGMSEEAQNYARARIRVAMTSYEELSSRIEAARIELDTTRAAFKYRYSIITPPLLPKAPEKPNLAVLAVAGLVAAVFLALAAASLRDLASGRVLEPWQVEKHLGLPVLAELREK